MREIVHVAGDRLSFRRRVVLAAIFRAVEQLDRAAHRTNPGLLPDLVNVVSFAGCAMQILGIARLQISGDLQQPGLGQVLHLCLRLRLREISVLG